jgi:hypothetical protein
MNRAAKRKHFNRAILATDAIEFLKLMRQTLRLEGVGNFPDTAMNIAEFMQAIDFPVTVSEWYRHAPEDWRVAFPRSPIGRE